MEFGSIDREILLIDASPEVVFEVVSDPGHVRRWWPDEAHYAAEPGSRGEIVFTDHGGERVPVAFEVLEVVPPKRFAFRWTQPEGEAAVRGNSYLVVFELEAEGAATRLRMTETGFRERGWEAAVLEEAYRDHSAGWDHHLARLAPYIAGVGAP